MAAGARGARERREKEGVVSLLMASFPVQRASCLAGRWSGGRMIIGAERWGQGGFSGELGAEGHFANGSGRAGAWVSGRGLGSVQGRWYGRGLPGKLSAGFAQPSCHGRGHCPGE